MEINPASIFSSFNIKGMLGSAFNIIILVVIAGLVGGLAYMYFRWKSSKKSGIFKSIQWWEEIGGNLFPIREDKATEIIIPGTNLRVFYIKDKNMWLPRFSRGITSDKFFVAITKNKEMVNFTLRSIDKDLAKAKLTYDHTDMRWAAENLREFVKRNYKDKAVTWWKEYSGVIGVVIFVVVMTISLVTIIYFMRGIISDIGAVANSIAQSIDKINACSPGSGVVIQK